MTINYSKFYKNEENCYQALRNAREVFSSIHTTRKQYEAMQMTVARVFLYCPEDIKSLAQATILESNMRKVYFLSMWRKQEKQNVN